MRMEVEYTSGMELAVKVIFGEDFGLPVRLLNATTEDTKEIEELARAIEMIESYNDFRGKEVAEALRQLHEEGLIMSARFGREQSPVLYVTIPFHTHQRTKKLSRERRQFTVQERNAMFRRILEILDMTNPTELGPVLDEEVRAWWD